MQTRFTLRVVAAALAAVFTLTAAAQDAPPLSAEAAAQIAALQAEKAARTPAQRKLDSQLIHLRKKQRGEALGAGLEAYAARLKVPADGRVLVDISAKVSDGLLADLRAAGAEIVQAVPRFDAIRAKLPLARAEEFAGRKDVRFIKRATPAMTRTGPINSQGDGAHGAGTARTNFSVTGAGVKIGVISDSVDNLAASQAAGELPAITVLEDLPGESGEGTAMLEIVHDIAPGAQLFFATAFVSDAGFAQNILNLREAGCDIIVDDIFYFNESPFQNGIIAQAAEQVVADGALYFSATGNEGNKSKGTSGTWEGNFVDGGATAAPVPTGNRVHNFGGQNHNVITTAGFAETLHWSDPLGASTNDYDLYVLNAAGTAVLEVSDTTQDGTQDPFEITAAQTSGARAVVVKHAGDADRFLHLATVRGRLSISTNGTVAGHSASPNAIGVAAVNAGSGAAFTTSNTIETFSSDGPRRFFYNDDGTPITPGNFTATGGVVLNKPDMAAADGVSTSVPGFMPFFGTSAAAPHAAALAALIKSQDLSRSAAQVKAALLTGVLDIEQVGFDINSGAGIVVPAPGLATIPAAAKIVPQGVALVGESFTPANGTADPGEQITVSLGVRNTGGAPTTNLVATLLAQDGITEAQGMTFGAVPANNTTVTQNFACRANGPAGSTVTLTFRLRDGALDYGIVTQSYTLGTFGAPVGYNNTAAITINDDAAATPYPATINVAGFTGVLGKVTVTLTGLSHTYPSDCSFLLVSPSGRAVLFAGGIGEDNAVTNVTLTFDDAAASPPPATLANGTYRPVALFGTENNDLVAPAPAAPYPSALSTFAGDTANGAWQLYVQDFFGGDTGTISGGWALNLQPVVTANGGPGADVAVAMSATPNPALTGGQVTYEVTVYNNGPDPATGVVVSDTLPAGLAYDSATVSQGTVGAAGNVVTATLGTIPVNGTATLAIVADVTGSGVLANTASATTSAAENNAANNSASVSLTAGAPNLLPTQPAGWSSKLVVSNVAGTNTDTAIAPADPVFVDLALTNNGAVPAPAYFSTTLLVDGVVVRTFERQLAVATSGVFEVEDIPLPPLGAGPHVIRVIVDADDDVVELSEADNQFTRLINGVNTPPTISAIADLGVNEDTTTGPVAFTVDDDLTALGSLVLSAASSNPTLVPLANIVFGGSGANRTVTVTPAADASGSADLTITVTDEANATASETFTLTVTPVNDAPVVTAPANTTTNEDTAVTFASANGNALTVADSDAGGATLQVAMNATGGVLTVAPGSGVNFTTGDGSGDATVVFTGTLGQLNAALNGLSFAPTANLNGTGAALAIQASDLGNTGTGGPQTDSAEVAITLVAVNDAPSFVAGPDVQVLNDAGAQSITGWAGSISPGPADEAAQSVTFAVAADAPALFTVQPAISPDGTLTFTPAAGASGVAEVSVTAQDSGGTASGGANTSAAQTFLIGVLGETQLGGKYNGLALDPNLHPSLAATTSGFIAGTHADSGLLAYAGTRTGAFTAKLTLGGKTFKLKGTVGDGGLAVFGAAGQQLEIKRKGLPSLLLSLRLAAESDGDHLRGALRNGASTVSTIAAGRAVFSKTAPPPAALRDAANDGQHTVVFPARPAPNAGLIASQYPPGTGAATLVVDKKGGVKLKGTLADGTKFSAKTALDAGLNAPVHALLYKKKGSLLGVATFADVAGVSDVAGAEFVWFRPDQSTGAKPPKQYPTGWPNGLFTDLVGSRYVAPAGAAALPGVGPTDADGNARFTAAAGGLAAPLGVAVNIDAKSKVAVVLPGADALKLAIDPKTGLLEGTFKDASAAKPLKPAGVILQKQARGFGWFLGGTQGGTFTLAPQ